MIRSISIIVRLGVLLSAVAMLFALLGRAHAKDAGSFPVVAGTAYHSSVIGGSVPAMR
jgi:hypothetical protein